MPVGSLVHNCGSFTQNNSLYENKMGHEFKILSSPDSLIKL